MFRNIGPQVGVAVITAVTLGALALIGNFATSGGLVKALGGVPLGELAAEIKKIPKAELAALIGPPGPAGPEGKQGSSGSRGDPGNIAELPKDAVVAFADDSCPPGWSRYTKAHGRMIVGATENAEFLAEYSKGSDGKQLPLKKFGEHGGQATVTLTEAQTAPHAHALKRYYAYDFSTGPDVLVLTGESRSVEDGEASKWTFGRDRSEDLKTTDAAGGGQPHDIMPPYIALYFCTKD